MNLSSGSHKLYNVAQVEPAATTARYATLIGYTERSTRKFITELESVGLIQRVPRDQPSVVIDQEQTGIMRELIDFGVALQKARALARQYPEDVIREQMKAVRGTRDVINAPGLLIYRLKSYVPTPDAEALNTSANDAFQRDESEPVAEVLATELMPVQTSTLSILLSAEDTTQNPALDLAVPSFSGSALSLDTMPVELILLAYAVQMVTGLDLRLHEASRQTTFRLYELGYNANDVAVFADCVFKEANWRGQKGEFPTLEDLETYISAARMRDWRGKGVQYAQSKLRLVRNYLRSTESYRFTSLAELGQAAQDWDAELDNSSFLERQAEARRIESQRRPEYTGPESKIWDEVRSNLITFRTCSMIGDLRLVAVSLDGASNVETFSLETDDEEKRTYIQRQAAQTVEQMLTQRRGRPCKVQLVVVSCDDEGCPQGIIRHH